MTAGVASTLATTRPLRGAEPAEGSSQLVRIGLVGAGGRGGGAVNDTLSINENIKLSAIADLDPEKPAALRDSAASRHERHRRLSPHLGRS